VVRFGLFYDKLECIVVPYSLRLLSFKFLSIANNRRSSGSQTASPRKGVVDGCSSRIERLIF
jgi:hypothetical protein